jgi:dTDP-4-dehydrorhamnose reductase
LHFDVTHHKLSDLLDETKPDYIINCIGKIKPEIDEADVLSKEKAILINSLLPYQLAKFQGNCSVIQIATDCVYSGMKGNYLEDDFHDATDVYGKTKSLGEVNNSNILNLRCSIIGKELASQKSLLEWVINQKPNSTINGFLNHNWNGVTTLAFAKVVEGLLQGDEKSFNDRTYHLVPEDVVDKFSLVSTIAQNFNRHDLSINPIEAATAIDRTLRTSYGEVNAKLWSYGGYNQPPTIQHMIDEYAQWIS